MKIIRYNGSYRYKRQRRKRIIKTVLALTLALVVVGAAVFAVVKFAPSLLRREQPVAAPQKDYLLKAGEAAALDLVEGECYMLTLPEEVDIRGVAFSSDNSEVARVDSAGRTDALSEGEAKITAASDSFSAECVITVTKAPEAEQRNELTTAIIANTDTVKKNSEKGSDDLYNITVNRRTNTVTVYTYDGDGNYTVPVRAMVASCGTSGADITPTGDYSIYFRESWHPLYGGVFGMYISGFKGPYLFHSVPYYTKNHGKLEVEEFNKLGTNASQGCVRLMAADARWIYKNCALNTPVKVVDADASADPLGTPPAVKLRNSSGWDPTDPDKNNPYKGKQPTIKGAEDVTLKQGGSFDPAAGVSAEDICGNDITDRVAMQGRVITDKPGNYYLSYSVTDEFNQTVTASRTVTVEEND